MRHTHARAHTHAIPHPPPPHARARSRAATEEKLSAAIAHPHAPTRTLTRTHIYRRRATRPRCCARRCSASGAHARTHAAALLPVAPQCCEGQTPRRCAQRALVARGRRRCPWVPASTRECAASTRSITRPVGRPASAERALSGQSPQRRSAAQRSAAAVPSERAVGAVGARACVGERVGGRRGASRSGLPGHVRAGCRFTHRPWLGITERGVASAVRLRLPCSTRAIAAQARGRGSFLCVGGIMLRSCGTGRDEIVPRRRDGRRLRRRRLPPSHRHRPGRSVARRHARVCARVRVAHLCPWGRSGARASSSTSTSPYPSTSSSLQWSAALMTTPILPSASPARTGSTALPIRTPSANAPAAMSDYSAGTRLGDPARNRWTDAADDADAQVPAEPAGRVGPRRGDHRARRRPEGSRTLAAVPLAAVPLAAVPLAAVPLAAVPLAAVPLAAVPLAAVPLAARANACSSRTRRAAAPRHAGGIIPRGAVIAAARSSSPNRSARSVRHALWSCACRRFRRMCRC
jgi:hypothetical protein